MPNMGKTARVNRTPTPLTMYSDVHAPPSRRTKRQQAIYDEGYHIGNIDGIQEGYQRAVTELKKQREEFDRERRRFRASAHGARTIARSLHDLLDATGVD